MLDLGYETHNSLLNLGSLAIFASIYFVEVFVFLILLVISFSGWKAPFLDKWAARLFFNDLIALLLDAYMEFMISGYL